MARGKKTDIQTKAKIAEMRICQGKQGSDIAREIGVPETTVSKVLREEVAEVCRDSDLVQNIISDAMEASRIMGEISLKMAKNIKLKQKQEEEGAEGFAPTTDEIRTLNITVESGFKRAQLLQNKPTENIGVVDGAEILRQIQNGNISTDNAYDALRQTKE